jgi:hypothetical protein
MDEREGEGLRGTALGRQLSFIVGGVARSAAVVHGT